MPIVNAASKLICQKNWFLNYQYYMIMFICKPNSMLLW